MNLVASICIAKAVVIQSYLDMWRRFLIKEIRTAQIVITDKARL